MKETRLISSPCCDDHMLKFNHQTLLQDYQKLQQEIELRRNQVEMMKQKRSILIAEVRFLRRRYKHLKQDQTLETSPKMRILSESVPCFDLMKQKNTICNEKEASLSLANNATCDLEKKLKRSRENKEENNFRNRKVSDFDLNKIQ